MVNPVLLGLLSPPGTGNPNKTGVANLRAGELLGGELNVHVSHLALARDDLTIQSCPWRQSAKRPAPGCREEPELPGCTRRHLAVNSPEPSSRRTYAPPTGSPPRETIP